jgi:hypothetical protein
MLNCLRNCFLCVRKDLGEIEWGDVDWIGLAQDRDKWRTLVYIYY